MTAISQTTFSNAFLEWKLLYSYSNFTAICSKGPKYQYAGIGSDDGLAPNRRQAIILTNTGLVYWRIQAALSLSELSQQPDCWYSRSLRRQISDSHGIDHG